MHSKQKIYNVFKNLTINKRSISAGACDAATKKKVLKIRNLLQLQTGMLPGDASID